MIGHHVMIKYHSTLEPMSSLNQAHIKICAVAKPILGTWPGGKLTLLSE